MKKMGKKGIREMILAMVLFSIVYVYSFELLSSYAELKDIVSVSPNQVIAESDTWKLRVPKKDGLCPYLTYRGNWKDIAPYVTGMVCYNTGDSSEIQMEGSDGYIFKDNHFVYGEERWIFSEYYNKRIMKAFLKIRWEENGKPYSEYLFSENLSQKEKDKADLWIEEFDKEYTQPHQVESTYEE